MNNKRKKTDEQFESDSISQKKEENQRSTIKQIDRVVSPKSQHRRPVSFVDVPKSPI